MKIKTETKRTVYDKTTNLTIYTRHFHFDYNMPQGNHGNCLYLMFNKHDYPKFLIRKDFDTNTLSDASQLHKLPMHGGITYFKIDNELVTIGCDYQHAFDDYYQNKDAGVEILQENAQKLINAFIELHKSV